MEWISVDEDLPEDDQAVLVAGKPYGNKGMMFSVGMRDNFKGEWFEADDMFGWIDPNDYADEGFSDLEGITHWMPIPELPEEPEQCK